VRTAVSHPGWFQWAGLALGPAAWAVGQQLGYWIVPWVCARGAWPTNAAVSLAAAIAAGAGAVLSWRSRQALRAGVGGDAEFVQSRAFLAAISALLGALFAVAMLFQAMAGLIFGGCED
jgi:hypothetical protein